MAKREVDLAHSVYGFFYIISGGTVLELLEIFMRREWLSQDNVDKRDGRVRPRRRGRTI